jgi:hypothetical protein
VSREFREQLSEADARDYSDYLDREDADRWQRERHDDMAITAAMAARRERIHLQRAAEREEQEARLPATPSRLLGGSPPITGHAADDRARILRTYGQSYINQTDRTGNH